MIEDILQKVLKGQPVQVSVNCDLINELEQYPPFPSEADLSSWCSFFYCSFTYDPVAKLYTITKNN